MQRKVWKLLFVMFQVLSIQRVKKGPGVSVEGICVKLGRLVVVLDERVSSLNHEGNVLLGRNVEAWIIKERGGKSLCHSRVPDQRLKKMKRHLMLLQHASNCSIAYTGHFGASCQDNRLHHVLRDVQCAHVDETTPLFSCNACM